MFKYRVIGKGTYNGRFYSPHEAKSERRIIEVEKKFSPVPKWLTPVTVKTPAPPREVKKSVVDAREDTQGTKDFAGGKQEIL